MEKISYILEFIFQGWKHFFGFTLLLAISGSIITNIWANFMRMLVLVFNKNKKIDGNQKES